MSVSVGKLSPEAQKIIELTGGEYATLENGANGVLRANPELIKGYALASRPGDGDSKTGSRPARRTRHQ